MLSSTPWFWKENNFPGLKIIRSKIKERKELLKQYRTGDNWGVFQAGFEMQEDNYSGSFA